MGDPQDTAELSPEPGSKLGTLVQDDVTGESMQTGDVLKKELSGFSGRGEFGYGRVRIGAVVNRALRVWKAFSDCWDQVNLDLHEVS